METKPQEAYKVSLKRTVFLPKGSPGICTVESIYMQLRTKELSSSGAKIYGLGDIDILIQYLSQGEQDIKNSIYSPDRSGVQAGKTWQALLACPFEFLVDGSIECAPLWKLETGTVEWFMVTPRVLEMSFEVLILPPSDSDLEFPGSGQDATSSVDFPWQDHEKGAVNKLSNIKEWKKENLAAENISAETIENMEAEDIENIEAETVENIKAESTKTIENAENIAAQKTKSVQEKGTQSVTKAQEVAVESANKWQHVSGKTAANEANVAGETIPKKESVSPAVTTKAESASPWKKESLAAENQQNLASVQTKAEKAVENENAMAEAAENVEAAATKTTENVSAQSAKTEKAAANQTNVAENEIAATKETEAESVSKKAKKTKPESTKQAKASTLAQATVKQAATKSTQAMRGGKLSFYRVQEGDDLVSVAMRAGVSLDALISRNQLTGGEIMPGMLLIIPR